MSLPLGSRSWLRRFGVCVTAAGLLGVAAGVARGPILTGAGTPLVKETLAQAAGTPVLAEDQLAEQVALAGGRIWIGNPIDAFRRRDQRVYVEWLRGRPAGDAALRHAPRAVLVRTGSDADRRLARAPAVARVDSDENAVL